LFAVLTDDEQRDAVGRSGGGSVRSSETNAWPGHIVTLATKYCAPLGLSRS